MKALEWMFKLQPVNIFVAASKFCAEYFDQQKGDSHPALSVLRQLKSAAEQLTLEVSPLFKHFALRLLMSPTLLP